MMSLHGSGFAGVGIGVSLPSIDVCKYGPLCSWMLWWKALMMRWHFPMVSSSLEDKKIWKFPYGVLHCTWLKSISRKFCWVFSPTRVSQDKYLCSLLFSCACYYLSDPFVLA